MTNTRLQTGLTLLRAAVGDDPAEWYPALTGHAWPGGSGTSEDEGAGGEMPFRLAAE